MDNLIARAQCQVHKVWNRKAWKEIAHSNSIAYIMNIFNRVRSGIECSLWTDDVDFVTIVESLTDEGYILQ